MNDDEIKVLNQQVAFRQKLEGLCKAEGWSLKDVFYSDIPCYVNPDDQTYKWYGKGDKPNWVRRYEEKHSSLDAVRFRAVVDEIKYRPG
jgi:hypothetical protein